MEPNEAPRAEPVVSGSPPEGGEGSCSSRLFVHVHVLVPDSSCAAAFWRWTYQKTTSHAPLTKPKEVPSCTQIGNGNGNGILAGTAEPSWVHGRRPWFHDSMTNDE